jgi:hypothetical protein
VTGEQRSPHQLAVAAVTACRTDALHELASMIVEEDQCVVTAALTMFASLVARNVDEHFACDYASCVEEAGCH